MPSCQKRSCRLMSDSSFLSCSLFLSLLSYFCQAAPFGRGISSFPSYYYSLVGLKSNHQNLTPRFQSCRVAGPSLPAPLLPGPLLSAGTAPSKCLLLVSKGGISDRCNTDYLGNNHQRLFVIWHYNKRAHNKRHIQDIEIFYQKGFTGANGSTTQRYQVIFLVAAEICIMKSGRRWWEEERA